MTSAPVWVTDIKMGVCRIESYSVVKDAKAIIAALLLVLVVRNGILLARFWNRALGNRLRFSWK